MKPRIEQKIEVEPKEYLHCLRWLSAKGGKILHPQRQVSSIYFDTPAFALFYDTVEGVVPRRKIRVRWYGALEEAYQASCFTLEKKMTTEFARFKETSNSVDLSQLVASGHFDEQYGYCYPQLKVSYLRSYYDVDGYRVTLDTDITYSPFEVNGGLGSSRAFREPNHVLEIKTSIDADRTKLSNLFELPRSRFSKYEKAVESLFDL